MHNKSLTLLCYKQWWSHAHGDAAIITTCRILAKHANVFEAHNEGKTCVAMRLGGDEIVIAFIAAPGYAEDSDLIAERDFLKNLHEEVCTELEKDFPFAPLRPQPKEKRTGEFLRVRGPSISIGVSSWNECGPGHEFNKVDAEEQLYHLKDNKLTGTGPLERGGGMRFLDDFLNQFQQSSQEAMDKLRKDGLALKDFPALSADPDIVMAAVKKDGLALQYLKPYVVHV